EACRGDGNRRCGAAPSANRSLVASRPTRSKRELALGRGSAPRLLLRLDRLGGRLPPVRLDQFLDAVLGLVAPARGAVGERHAFLVVGQRLVERQLAALELLDDVLELAHRLLESGFARFGRFLRRLLTPHESLPRAPRSRAHPPRPSRTRSSDRRPHPAIPP